LGGATDYLLGALAVGGKGAITGLANVAPRACAKAFELFQVGRHAEALEIAGEISKAEWSLGKGGILGTKVSPTRTFSIISTVSLNSQYSVVHANSYPATAALGRKPLPAVSPATKAHVESECTGIIALERQLEKDGYVGHGLREGHAGGAPIKKPNSVNGANGLSMLGGVKEKVAVL
jgi:hypothetical protein